MPNAVVTSKQMTTAGHPEFDIRYRRRKNCQGFEMDSDPRCVYVAEDRALAEAVVGWLAAQGIPAEVMDRPAPDGLEGLGALSGFSAAAQEVWVSDSSASHRARQLLVEHEQKLRAKREDRVGAVDVVCEECGETTAFPAAEQGTVQECPHCQAFLDVPDPDEDWGDDFGEDVTEKRDEDE
jgi:hypothetical protein